MRTGSVERFGPFSDMPLPGAREARPPPRSPRGSPLSPLRPPGELPPRPGAAAAVRHLSELHRASVASAVSSDQGSDPVIASEPEGGGSPVFHASMHDDRPQFDDGEDEVDGLEQVSLVAGVGAKEDNRLRPGAVRTRPVVAVGELPGSRPGCIDPALKSPRTRHADEARRGDTGRGDTPAREQSRPLPTPSGLTSASPQLASASGHASAASPDSPAPLGGDAQRGSATTGKHTSIGVPLNPRRSAGIVRQHSGGYPLRESSPMDVHRAESMTFGQIPRSGTGTGSRSLHR